VPDTLVNPICVRTTNGVVAQVYQFFGGHFHVGADRIGQGSVPGGPEKYHVCSVFVFHSEKYPYESSQNLRERYAKTSNGRLLHLIAEKRIEDPLEPQDHIGNHCKVVDHGVFEK
jgi:hypothetical protein